MNRIDSLRKKVDELNEQLLDLLNERAKITLEIGKEKQRIGKPIYDPIREEEILTRLIELNPGPLPNSSLIMIFREIFKACRMLQEQQTDSQLLIKKTKEKEQTTITVKGVTIGGDTPTHIFGPCAIESRTQLEQVAEALVKTGCRLLRGGAYKPRTSPHRFQGLGLEGLQLMKEITEAFGLVSVVEVMDERTLQEALPYIDIIQIGARNMYNYPLLKAIGQIDKPVILKRGLSATIEELKLAAEYILQAGNPNVILCERGIRTYETATRNTLDISAIPVLKNETHLPVIVDVSHAAGRKDILLPLARASMAAGADGIMAEVHPNPQFALSDANQQLSLEEFYAFMEGLKE